MITQERLKELLDYNPSTGTFTRKSTGLPAGNPMTGGYLRLRVDGKEYLCHRLAWLYVHGVIPPTGIDHRNTRTNDNRISNLRPATHSQNAQNLAVLPRNSSGFPGVTWVANRNKWQAKIRLNGRSHHIGMFSSAAEASAAYLAKKKELHPHFTK